MQTIVAIKQLTKCVTFSFQLKQRENKKKFQPSPSQDIRVINNSSISAIFVNDLWQLVKDIESEPKKDLPLS